MYFFFVMGLWCVLQRKPTRFLFYTIRNCLDFACIKVILICTVPVSALLISLNGELGRILGYRCQISCFMFCYLLLTSCYRTVACVFIGDNLLDCPRLMVKRLL